MKDNCNVNINTDCITYHCYAINSNDIHGAVYTKNFFKNKKE